MDNFKKNSSLLDGTIEYKVQTKIACLVSAGPSLNETVHCLLTCQSKVDIYVVGAALKVLLANGVFQKTAVLSDRSEFTLEQFENTEFKGELFYLSTTHHQTVVNHNGPRFILYQKGYQLAEKRGTSELFLEIRGSVGTTTFSLLE